MQFISALKNLFDSADSDRTLSIDDIVFQNTQVLTGGYELTENNSEIKTKIITVIGWLTDDTADTSNFGYFAKKRTRDDKLLEFKELFFKKMEVNVYHPTLSDLEIDKVMMNSADFENEEGGIIVTLQLEQLENKDQKKLRLKKEKQGIAETKAQNSATNRASANDTSASIGLMTTLEKYIKKIDTFIKETEDDYFKSESKK